MKTHTLGLLYLFSSLSPSILPFSLPPHSPPTPSLYPALLSLPISLVILSWRILKNSFWCLSSNFPRELSKAISGWFHFGLNDF